MYMRILTPANSASLEIDPRFRVHPKLVEGHVSLAAMPLFRRLHVVCLPGGFPKRRLTRRLRCENSGKNPLPMKDHRPLPEPIRNPVWPGVVMSATWFASVVLTLFLLAVASLSHAVAGTVSLERVPENGIQPQVAVDDAGRIHLLFFKGAPAAGDLFYSRKERPSPGFQTSIRVNSRASNVMAVGTIRGGQLAVGKGGRVHVAWNGPVPKGGDWMQAPMLYTRLNDAGTAFEPERDVIGKARGLDGGGSVAADGEGHVYVAWHAPKPGSTNGEAGRAVFIAQSGDGGRTFAVERPALGESTGACGCCSMKIFAGDHGRLFVSYRGALETGQRDQNLLVARDWGSGFRISLTDPWKVATCPMSSTTFSKAPHAVLAAWETSGQVRWARWDDDRSVWLPPLSPVGGGKNRKHPVAVGNDRGEVLLAWTEETGWAKGGVVAWQLFDKDGRPTETHGRRDGVPAWSLVGAYSDADGRFVILY